MKTGLYGGTFDPIHLGHTHAAASVFESLSLDRILFIPSAEPPHKKGRSISSFQHRKNMVELALQSYPYFAVSDIENQRQGPSYTIDTIERLLNLFPQDEFYLLMGADMSSCISTWKDYDKILNKIHLAIFSRKDESPLLDPNLNPFQKEKLQNSIITFDPLPWSSTQARTSSDPNALKKMLDDQVYQYIIKHHLYDF